MRLSELIRQLQSKQTELNNDPEVLVSGYGILNQINYTFYPNRGPDIILVYSSMQEKLER